MMQMTIKSAMVAGLLALGMGQAAHAALNTYDISTLNGSQGWQSGDTRAGGTVQLTTLGGQDALVLTTDSSIAGSGQAKATAEIVLDTPIPLYYFGSISMEWYRDASSSDANMRQMPGLRLVVQNSNGDIAELVWEWAENSADPLVEDAWVTQSLTSDPNNKFWIYSDSHNFFNTPTSVNDGSVAGTSGEYAQTLGFWKNGGTITDGAFTSIVLDDMTDIIGIKIGMGSGVEGYFMGGISSLNFGYMNSYPGGRPVKPSIDTYNFFAEEVTIEAVPEPATAALGLMSVAGLMMASRRRRV